APLYWSRAAHGAWQRFSVHGPVPVLAAEPVAHLSYYEADAYARFAGARLPTEAEWEVIARDAQWSTPSADAQLRGQFEPPAQRMPGFGGAVWEWTSSAYAPYPGFKPL